MVNGELIGSISTLEGEYILTRTIGLRVNKDFISSYLYREAFYLSHLHERSLKVLQHGLSPSTGIDIQCRLIEVNIRLRMLGLGLRLLGLRFGLLWLGGRLRIWSWSHWIVLFASPQCEREYPEDEEHAQDLVHSMIFYCSYQAHASKPTDYTWHKQLKNMRKDRHYQVFRIP